MARLLTVMTGADHLTLNDGTARRTGFWAEEFVVPHEQFRAAGVVVEIATPGGVPSPLDPRSLLPEMNGGDLERVRHFREYLDSLEDLKRPRVLEQLSEEQVDAYDAIFLPGGHGPMQDLAHSEALGAIIRRFQDSQRIVSAVCHGPAGLLPAIREDRTWVFRDYRLTSFTNQEERMIGLADKVPFLLENRLRELGGVFEEGEPWKPHVVADRNLITGQNPASSAGVADKALARLGAAVSG